MRAFIVLCLVAVTCADKLGYNYKPVDNSNVFGHLPDGFNGGVVGSSVAGVSSFTNSVSGSGLGGVSINSGVVGSVSGNFNDGVSYAPQAELEKEFYTFTANEADFSTPHVDHQIANSAKKGLRVIFIKGPENNGLENAAVSLAKHIAEQKTAIYVLQKQADIGSLTHKLNTINSNINHKPEVHFVKYGTAEDAVNAQKAIQGQYDALGGVSNSFNGGQAPVLNFVSQSSVASSNSHGSLGYPVPVGSAGSHGSFGTSSSTVSVGSIGTTGVAGLPGFATPSNSYIPPAAPSSTYLPA